MVACTSAVGTPFQTMSLSGKAFHLRNARFFCRLLAKCELNAHRMRYVVVDCTPNARRKHPDCNQDSGGGGGATTKMRQAHFLSEPCQDQSRLLWLLGNARRMQGECTANAKNFGSKSKFNGFFFSSRLAFVSPICVCVTGLQFSSSLNSLSVYSTCYWKRCCIGQPQGSS